MINKNNLVYYIIFLYHYHLDQFISKHTHFILHNPSSSVTRPLKAHWISKPGSGHRSTGKFGSKLTKLVYALHPASLTRILCSVLDPPVLNVQHSPASLHGATLSVWLAYTWHKLADVQFSGDWSRVSVQLRSKIVLLLVMLKGSELLSWIPSWTMSEVTHVSLDDNVAGLITSRWLVGLTEVMGYVLSTVSNKSLPASQRIL